MGRNSHLFRRHALVTALTLISAGCNGHPALLAEISGKPAADFVEDLEGDFAQPVLLTRSHGNVIAVVFAEDPADIRRLLDELLVPEVEGCGRGGWFGREGWIGRQGPVLCCDLKKGTLAINSERGWLDTGEHCGSSDAEEPPIKFEKVDEEFSRFLKQVYRIDHRFSTVAGKDGRVRPLVHGPLPSEELQPQEPVRQGSGLDASQIILAGHKLPTPAGGCVWNLGSSCSIPSSSARCRKGYWHRYIQDSDTTKWCEYPPTCGC